VTHEERRLEESIRHIGHWKRWGPYLSERAWGTVREDYSLQGTARDHLPHEHARSKAYRWGEDGIGGFCDRHQAKTVTEGETPVASMSKGIPRCLSTLLCAAMQSP
jgi:hypothetical protein